MEDNLKNEVERILGAKFSYEEVEEGLNTIYLLKNKEKDYILKLHTNKNEGFSEGYKDDQKARFRAEARIYEMVNSETDVPSPEIVHTDFSEEKVSHQFYIMERLEGENLDFAKENSGREKLADLLKSYGQLLSEIHDCIELDSYGLIIEKDGGFGYLEEGDTWQEAFRNILHNMRDIIEERWEEPPEIDLEELEEEIKKLPENPDPVLVHSDNRLENVLVQDGKITGFLDWSFTRSGHAMYDLARAEYLLIDYDLKLGGKDEAELEELREKLLEGYEGVMDEYRQNRAIYRYATVLWIVAGFPNWSSDWEEDRRESFRQELLNRLEKEKPV